MLPAGNLRLTTTTALSILGPEQQHDQQRFDRADQAFDQNTIISLTEPIIEEISDQ